MMTAPPIEKANLYTILSLPTPSPFATPISTPDIKSAARKSLLLHHPDKARISQSIHKTNERQYSVDEVYKAKRILTDPTLRQEYDRSLVLEAETGQIELADVANGLTGFSGRQPVATTAGMEVVDLDEMTWLQNNGVWTRSCRCGNERGYEMKETDLVESPEAQEGELLLECKDCSLCILVLFGIVDENEAREGDLRGKS